VAAFLGLLVAVFGVVAFVERGSESFPVSYDDGHLDATTVQGAAGPYAFLSTQPGTKEPVTYPPCRVVQVRINPADEVVGGTRLVLDAMARVSELSNLPLEYVGPSTQRPDEWSDAMEGGMEAYPPALVSWSHEDETPELAGDVVGLGGSISVRGAAFARTRYMTGSVTLDAPDLAEVLEGPDGEAQVRAVILHELGHLVGLGHVADPGELMSETNYGNHDFGPGDREGLARLGGGDC
jgi:Matrixin